jgi:hypothetical protein
MRLVVMLIRVDLVLFAFTLHCCSQVCKTLRCSRSLSEARLGMVSEDNIAVSSAKVAIRVMSVVGMSAVKMRYNKGPRTLPCGIPACTG